MGRDTRFDFYKCKFCDFQVAKWWRSPSGKSLNGLHVIYGHVETEHPEKLEEFGIEGRAEDLKREENTEEGGGDVYTV